MKECFTCKVVKPITEFGKNSKKEDGLAIHCLICKREYDKRFYTKTVETRRSRKKVNVAVTSNRNKKYVTNYLKEHPCIDCGNKNIIVLEFDHVTGSKEYNVSEMISRNYSLEKIIAEIAKCEVRCANCHRIVTYERRIAKKLSEKGCISEEDVL